MFSQVWVLPEVWQDTEFFDTITLIFDMSSTNGQVIVHLQPLHNPHMNKELGGDGPCYLPLTKGFRLTKSVLVRKYALCSICHKSLAENTLVLDSDQHVRELLPDCA